MSEKNPRTEKEALAALREALPGFTVTVEGFRGNRAFRITRGDNFMLISAKRDRHEIADYRGIWSHYQARPHHQGADGWARLVGDIKAIFSSVAP